MGEAPGGDAVEPGTIRGRVSTASGDAVGGASVMIGGNSPPHPDIAAVTSPGGEFRFGGLVPGDYEIHAYVDERLLARRVRVAAGQVAEVEFLADE